MSAERIVRCIPVLAAATWLAILHDWYIDDAGIVFAYARNVAFGLGPVPHPHSAPIEGYSDPLWMLALAVARGIGLPIPATAKLFGAVATIATCWILDGALKHHRATVTQRGATALALMMCGPLWLWSLSGLESAWVGLAITSIVLIRSPWLAAAAAFALVGLRPEAPVLLLGATAGRYAMGRRIGVVVVASAMAVLASHGIRWWAFGDLWPQTAAAKLNTSLIRRVLRGARYAITSGFWLGLPVVLLGTKRQDGHPTLHRLSVASFWVASATLLATLYMGGDWMRYARFWVPIMPLLMAGAVPILVVQRSYLPVTALCVWLMAVCADVSRRPALPMALVSEAAVMLDDLVVDGCEQSTTHIAMPDVGGALWSLPHAQVTDLAKLTTAPRSSWADAFRSDPPQAVIVHGPWTRRTGLTPEVLSELGYRTVCERPAAPGPEEAVSPTTAWLLQRCTGQVRAETERIVAEWCARTR